MKTDIEKILEAVGVNVITARNGLMMVVIPTIGCDYLRNISDDLNAIRELELLVIEKFGAGRYGHCLLKTVNNEPITPSGNHHVMLDTEFLEIIATADAATRITAMLAVIEEAK